MMYWEGGHWAFWQAGLMWLGMLLFWALVIWAVYAIVRSLTQASQSSQRERPSDILERRLANGEIDVDEYRRRMEAMRTPVDASRVEVGSRT